jgi:NADH-quinone oxidoreductase subunit L
MLDLVWLIPALPLAGFGLLLLLGRRIGEPGAGWIATLFSAGSFAASVLVWVGLLGEEGEGRIFEQVLFSWIPVGDLQVDVGLLVDPLSVAMVLFVTGVGTVIHLYSIGYMHGDPDFSKYFVYMNLFLFAMTMLVLGNNMVVTFVGWEGVGACSYFLIAYWHHDMRNAVAGKKAFITNRVGDWGYLVAMFLVWQVLGTLTYTEIFARAGTLTETTATAISLLLLLAAAGKSAQLPLFVWLPDAMAGPTPVSALIHAATMVTAGVYVLIRMSPVLDMSDTAMWTVAIVGTATALFAALAALAQNDIKRVLAYSTISQLGYMFLAVGSGAFVAALFHMITHAFFKALLFLGAGSVIHGMGGEQDMRRMGGLARVMPVTAVTFAVGVMAIAGLPPLAGFWSKDEILVAAFDFSPALWAVALVTAVLTGYYMTRQFILVFLGRPRWDAAIHGERPAHEPHPHESPLLMTLPLIVLALAAGVAGVLNPPLVGEWLVLDHFLEPTLEGVAHVVTLSTEAKMALALVALAGSLIGVVFAFTRFLGKRAVAPDALEPAVLQRAMYVDDAYGWAVAHPGHAAFEGLAQADERLVDGAVEGVGVAVSRTGQGLRVLQSGYVRNYAIGIGLGSLALIVLFLSRAGL